MLRHYQIQWTFWSKINLAFNHQISAFSVSHRKQMWKSDVTALPFAASHLLKNSSLGTPFSSQATFWRNPPHKAWPSLVCPGGMGYSIPYHSADGLSLDRNSARNWRQLLTQCCVAGHGQGSLICISCSQD